MSVPGIHGHKREKFHHTVVFKVEEVVSDVFVLVSDVEVVKSEEEEVVVTESCTVSVSVSVSMRILVWTSVEVMIVWMGGVVKRRNKPHPIYTRYEINPDVARKKREQ